MPVPRPRPIPLPVPELIQIQPTEEATDSIDIQSSTEEDQNDDEGVANSRRKKRMISAGWGFPGWGFSAYDATKSFRDSSIVYLSDLNIHRECRSGHSRRFKTLGRAGSFSIQESLQMGPMHDADNQIYASMMEYSTSLEPQVAVKQTVRAFFPETWLWHVQVSNEKGLIERVEKSPDSITDWQLDAYCFNSNSGLGVAETRTLNVFQSMFISMTLPYSVVKGEVFPVKATVFNYASTCVPIQIELLADRRFNLKKDESTASYCICADEKVTHEFSLEAGEIEMSSGLRVAASVTSVVNGAKGGATGVDICQREGRSVVKAFRFRDVEAKFVIVEPEGVPKEHVENSLVLFKCEIQRLILCF